MGVRQLHSGAWQPRVQVNGSRLSETFPSRQEAEEWEVVTRAQGVLGRLPGRLAVREYAVQWMDTGGHPIARVTPTDIARLVNDVHQQVSAAKADHVYKTLKAMFHAAEQDDLIPREPTRPKKHRPRRQKNPHVVHERPQARRMLLQLRGWHRDTALLQLALGARFSEIAGLTPHDIEAGRVHIRRRVAKGTVRATKNHRARTLELPTATTSTVTRLIREAGDPPPIPDLEDREWSADPFRRRWLIQTRTGRPASLPAYGNALKVACPAAGVPVLSSHGLRHTYVSWMIDDGHSADKIAFWIGDTPATVRAVYAHMLEASSAPAADSIDAALAELGSVGRSV